MADLTALEAIGSQLVSDIAAAAGAFQALQAQIVALQQQIAAESTEQTAVDAVTKQLTAADAALKGAISAPAPAAAASAPDPDPGATAI